MPNLTQHYLAHYAPLVAEFVRGVESLPHPDIAKMPEPFLPAFGVGYERSALRLVIIGQDTRGWGDLKEFIEISRADPTVKLKETLDSFRTHEFTEWGGSRHHFWGFALMMLAALHGQEDWGLLKQGAMDELLSSFAWGNGNAVELYSSQPSKTGIPWEYWEQVRKAGAHFDRFRHLVETIQPHVAIVLWRGMNPHTYFEGLKWEKVSQDGRLAHYRLPEIGVNVFHAPHPRSMGYIEGADHFCGKLKELFFQQGVTKLFPGFLAGQAEGESVMDFIRTRAPVAAPGFDKYAFVDWVAEELRKRGTFMSVPTLVTLVNAQGYRTNYGTEFSGGRGSYKLVSGTYHRLEDAGHFDRARNVAVAFRKPNFEYAYNTE